MVVSTLVSAIKCDILDGHVSKILRLFLLAGNKVRSQSDIQAAGFTLFLGIQITAFLQKQHVASTVVTIEIRTIYSLTLWKNFNCNHCKYLALSSFFEKTKTTLFFRQKCKWSDAVFLDASTRFSDLMLRLFTRWSAL